MTVHLRPHHLLYMLTYVGRGYNAGFVENYDRVIARLNAGEDIRLVTGPDDICAPLTKQHKRPHCVQKNVRDRDRTAAKELALVLGHSLRAGDQWFVTPQVLMQLRSSFTAHLRGACCQCPWSGLCDEVAGHKFSDSRLRLDSDINTV